MIQEKLIDKQVGIQYKGVNDLTENDKVKSLTHGVLIGKFKRGFKKPFVVSSTTYRKLLGYDPNNPDYKAVEEFFASGGRHLTIVRTGSPKQQIRTKQPSLIKDDTKKVTYIKFGG